MGLLDALEDAARSGRVKLTLEPSGASTSLASIWISAGRAAAALAKSFEPGARVGFHLRNDVPTVVAVIGAWRAGLCVVSLPDGAGTHVPLDVHSMNPNELELSGRELGSGRESEAGLIQFTSGTQNTPKGVELSLEALDANINAILDRLEPQAPAVSCSWLPLSHDMGLVGMLLAAWCATGPARTGDGELVFIDPSAFALRPYLWLEMCDSHAATLTAVPPSVLDIARVWMARRRRSDLQALESIIVGSELVLPEVLSAFEECAVASGLSPLALRPAYGCAEMALCVSMTASDERWTAALQPIDQCHSSVAAVSTGRPVTGARASIDEEEIVVGGTSLMTRYVGEATMERHHTGDRGAVVGKDLYPLGRLDDVVATANGAVFAPLLERRLTEARVVGRNRSAVLADLDGGYVVAVEARRGRDVSSAVAHLAAEAFGDPPSDVIHVDRGLWPLTHSGKLQRDRVADLIRRRDA